MKAVTRVVMMNHSKLPIENFVIIGSYALQHRYAKDIDVVCYENDIKTEYFRKDDFCGYFDFEGRRVELLFADKQESFQYLLDKYCGKVICPIHNLYDIKRGHIMFPNKNWEKHMLDLQYLTRILKYNYNMRKQDDLPFSSLSKLHKKSTEFRLGKDRTPKLNGVTKEEFFDDKVVKFYEHDKILSCIN